MLVITLEDLTGVLSLKKVIELTDDDKTGEVDAGHLDEAEASAIADLDLYAAKHYTLPLPAVAGVKEFVRQLTKCHLYFRRGVYPEEVMELYKMLQKKLEKLSPASLGIPGVEPAAGSDSAGVAVFSEAQRFPSGFMGNE